MNTIIPPIDQPITGGIRNDKFFMWSARIGIVLQTGLFILIFITWKKIPPFIPLFYSLPWGEEQLAPKMGLVILVCGLSLIYFTNMSLSYFLLKRSRFLAHVLLSSSALITILTAITVSEILLLLT